MTGFTPEVDIPGDFTSQISGKLQSPVATGSFGEIYRCSIATNEGKTEVAVKVFKIDRRRTIENLEKAMLRELDVWLRLKHSTIVPLFGTARVESPLLALVSQWMSSGTLADYLDEQAMIITPSARIGLAKGIADGLKYLHSENVVHGDLHPANVLIDGSGNPCLADFGLATVAENPDLQWNTTTVGRILDSRWRAPEVLGIDGDPERPTFKSDIYSFGSVMFFIISGDIPWKEKKHSIQICIELSKRTTPARPHDIFGGHWDLIQQCWTWNPEHRPAATIVGERAEDLIRQCGASGGSQPTHTRNDIIIDVDGSVRAGTVPALVEHLTSHGLSDPTFVKTFLMTYRSFTSLDELFDQLVRRFFIQIPDGLSSAEAEDWRQSTQFIIQTRVLNTFKSMVMDKDFFEKEDFYILDKMNVFLQNEEVSKISAARRLLQVALVERARGGDTKKGLIPNFGSPPTSIMPKSNNKLELLDINPLELARQLTIMESRLYQKIRPVECLQRTWERKTDYNDNIARVIQTSNRIAHWVTDSVLSHENFKKRAAILKQFISIADRCLSMHNYSSMVAIVSGLNSPPIRRLKRSWGQVNTRYMAQLGTCEMTIDSGKNFNNYRSTLAEVSPPCVPFIGVFLTTLAFIQDRSKDALPGNLVNFRKRQKASEVIQNIQRWQTFPHNFNPISSVQTYLEESLAKFSEQVDVGDYFWNFSLVREPRERDDEKMAQLLRENGFL